MRSRDSLWLIAAMAAALTTGCSENSAPSSSPKRDASS